MSGTTNNHLGVSSSPAGSPPSPQANPDHIPPSPGPYTHEATQAGPTAILQLQHGHFLITMSVTTTFPPSAVLPTVYSLLPASQLQCDHIDIQVDEKTHKMRVQVVGVNPLNNPHAVSTLAQRLKALQPGASVTVHKELSQLSVDSDSIAAISSLLMSSMSRALLDQHIHYYRLHSHPAFIPSLLIYISTSRVEHVINIMRNFMADPVAGGAVRPPRPGGLEVKGDEITSSAAAPVAVTVTPAEKVAPVTPEKPAGLPTHRTVSSSSRSPHFKPSSKNPSSNQTSLDLTGQSALATISSTSAATTDASASSSTTATAKPVAEAARPTSVAQTQAIRVDNKWWRAKRAELLTCIAKHSMTHDAFYVYSLDKLRANIKQMKDMSAISRLYYACKANNNPDLLRVIEAEGLGFECVSIQELKYIRELFPNIAKDRLLFTPNFASRLEYEEGYWYTDLLNLDNIYPLQQWGSIFKNKSVLLRMDPGEGAGYHAKMQTGGARSKFGITIDQLNENKDLMKLLNLNIVGLHVHKGSGIHDPLTWSRIATFLSTFLPQFPSIRILDLGGGMGVNYKDSDTTLDLKEMNQALLDFKTQLSASAGSQNAGAIELWLEPGRFLVANTCVLLSHVTQLKTKPGRSFVGISTGMNSLIRPALYESYHEIINLSLLDGAANPTLKRENGTEWLNTLDPTSHRLVDVVGPICETGDVLGYARSLPQATAEGDIILIDTCGAYGRVMSSEYNMRAPAKEVILQ